MYYGNRRKYEYPVYTWGVSSCSQILSPKGFGRCEQLLRTHWYVGIDRLVWSRRLAGLELVSRRLFIMSTISQYKWAVDACALRGATDSRSLYLWIRSRVNSQQWWSWVRNLRATVVLLGVQVDLTVAWHRAVLVVFDSGFTALIHLGDSLRKTRVYSSRYHFTESCLHWCDLCIEPGWSCQ